MECWCSKRLNGRAVPSCCIEVKRIFDLVWGALDLWVRGELDDGKDSFVEQTLRAQSFVLP